MKTSAVGPAEQDDAVDRRDRAEDAPVGPEDDVDVAEAGAHFPSSSGLLVSLNLKPKAPLIEVIKTRQYEMSMATKRSKITEATGQASGHSHAEGISASLVPLPEDHEYFGMAGRVASEWSHLEHLLDRIIWAMSDFENEIIACITAQIPGVPGRCRAIQALGGLIGIENETLKRVKKLKGDAYEVGDLRARVVHDPWYLELPSGSVAQFRAVPYGLEEISAQKIEGTIEKIRKLQSRAKDLNRDIRFALKALRART